MADRAFHLIGIGGVGTSMVVQLFAVRSAQVPGSDAHGGSAFDHLVDLGIATHLGHDAANVLERSTVMISTMTKETNPELTRVRRQDQDIIRRSQVLAPTARGLDFVIVAGAHGKATTSDMLAGTLTEAGADPSFAIDGVVRALGIGTHLGSSPTLVIEAGEPDQSFLNCTPRVKIATSVEPDHLNNYGTAEVPETAFVDFTHRLVSGNPLVTCVADAGISRLMQSTAAKGLRIIICSFASPDTLPGEVLVGEGHVCLDIQGREASSTRGLLTLITVASRKPAGDAGEEPYYGPVELMPTIPGDHVTLDTAGIQVAGIEPGVEPALIAQALSAFGGTGQRPEDRGETGGVYVINDCTHRPTEIGVLLCTAQGMAQERGGRVLVLFQPHLFSRAQAFADRFGQALVLTDVVVVTNVYPVREAQVDFPNIVRGTITQRVLGGTARFAVKRLDAAHTAADLARPDDLLLTVGARDAAKPADMVLDNLVTCGGGAAPSSTSRDERA